MVYTPCFALFLVVILSAASAYPMRSGKIQTSTPGTCASIGYTTGCCPLGTDCKATDGTVECFCSYDCHTFNDCCSDIVNVCPRNPTTCTELGFTDSCCVDSLNLGFCEIETNGVTCSCQSSCYLDNTCCSDIGCGPSTCSEAGLDPGCCEGNCTVQLGDDEACYCDEQCHDQGDCCEDVDQTKQCNRCTLTIVPGTVQQQRVPRPRLQSLELLERYLSRARKLGLPGTTKSRLLPPTQHAYVDKHKKMRERIASLLEARMTRAQPERRRRRGKN